MPAPIRFGRFLLLERLAVGGMAEIFLAKSVGAGGFERLCVIKRALPHLSQDPEFVRMFMDEARLAARLHHPGIVQIHDLGRCDDDYYIAMEYLAGEDLASVLVQSRKHGMDVPLEVAVRVIASAADALHSAHTYVDPISGPLRIVHRDVSPSNLFLTFHGVVKVLDFGVARAEGRLATTLAGVTKGKLSYMSPEQARGLEVDGRTDVWALGLCLRELLTGRRLFAGDAAPLDRLRQILHAPISPPSEERAAVPPELDRITLRALERDPERRYPTAAALAADLEALVSAPFSGLGSSTTSAEYLQSLYGPDHIRARSSLLQAPEPGVLHTAPLLPLRSGSQTVPAEGGPSPAAEATPPLLAAGRPTTSTSTGLQPAMPDVAIEATAAARSRSRALTVASAAGVLLLLLTAGLGMRWQAGLGSEAVRGGPTSVGSPPVSVGHPKAALSPEAPGAEAFVTAASALQTPSEDVASALGEPEVAGALPEGALADDHTEASSGVASVESPAPTATRRRTAASRGAVPGTLTVRANVPVEAFLGSRSLGPVPIEAVRVPPGRHALRLVDADRALQHQARIRIVSGRPTVHEAVLGTGTLNVDAVPWAKVWIDGKQLGLTPIAGHVLWEGPHQVRLEGPESTQTLSVRIRAGEVTSLREDLRVSSASR